MRMKTIDGLPLKDAILRMAIPTFVELGFDKASMDEVAARASTTKRTVYAHYGNKEELFRAALVLAVTLFLGDLPELKETGDPAKELGKFAMRFSELSTWRGAVRLQRVAMAEAERFPDIGDMMHREVIMQTERRIADFLRKLPGFARSGTKADTDAHAMELASLFLNMTTGPQRFATLLGARMPAEQHPNVASVENPDDARIRRAVAMFLLGSGLAKR